MEEFAILILIGFIVLVNAIIRKLAQSMARQQRAAGEGAQYEATPEQVRKFLQEIAGGARPAQAPPAARPAAGPVQPPVVPPIVPVEPEGQPAVPPAARVSPPSPPPRRPTRRRRDRRRPRPAQPALPVQEEVAAAARRAPVATGLRGFDLKQAVVWSEILGRPVSMRRHIGHRPPTRQE